MQTARTHGFDFGRVGLDGKELDFLAGHLGQVVDEGRPDVFVNGGIFDGRIGKDQSRRILEHALVCGRVGDQIAIGITEHRIQRTALCAFFGQRGSTGHGKGRQKARRYKATFHVFLLPENTRAEGTARLINRYEH